MIFGKVVDRTSTKSHCLQSFESKNRKQSILSFWRRLVVVLEIDPLPELEALRILWKLSQADIRVTKSVLFM